MHDIETPSPWMVRHAAYVKPRSELLDVACGKGRHARFFAARNVMVTAVDRDASALQPLKTVQNVRTEQRDLENDPWPYAEHSFDVVLVCNYLWRPAARELLATVKPGGLLLYETFMAGNEMYGKPSRPEFLLRPNELAQWVYGEFRVIAFDQLPERGPDGKPVAMKQRIAAIRNLPEVAGASQSATTDAGEAGEPATPQ